MGTVSAETTLPPAKMPPESAEMAKESVETALETPEMATGAAEMGAESAETAPETAEMALGTAETPPETPKVGPESAETAIGSAKVPTGNPRRDLGRRKWDFCARKSDQGTRQPPNELKLSDRPWRRKRWKTKRTYRHGLFAGARG